VIPDSCSSRLVVDECAVVVVVVVVGVRLEALIPTVLNNFRIDDTIKY